MFQGKLKADYKDVIFDLIYTFLKYNAIFLVVQ